MGTVEQDRDNWRAWALLWFVATVVLFFAAITLVVVARTPPAAEPALPATVQPVDSYRKDLAGEVFSYLYKHALCVEGQTPPCDWVYEGAYQLHKTAKDLYSTKPLKDIVAPVSEWDRGGFTEYYNPLDFLEHEMLLAKIYLLLGFGKSGIPPHKF